MRRDGNGEKGSASWQGDTQVMPRTKRSQNWLLPPSSHMGLGTGYSEWFERKSRITVRAGAGLHSQAQLPRAPAALGDTPGGSPASTAPTTGTVCQDLLHSLVLFRRGRQRWAGGWTGGWTDGPAEGSQVRGSFGAVSVNGSAANRAHPWVVACWAQ